MTRRTTAGGGLFKAMAWRQALELVDGSPSASRALRRRLAEDRQRDVLASVHDARVLCALQRLRVDALLDAQRRIDQPRAMED